MHDKIPTHEARNPGLEPVQNVRPKDDKKRGKPFQIVRFHSVNVPIYAVLNHGKIRYTIAFYIDGRRKRRMFAELEDAKREAKLAAEKIMRGMQAQNDLRPADRESFLAAQRILQEINMPLVAASEDYVQCRKLLGEVPLRQAVEDFCRRTNGVKLGVTVPEVAKEVIAAKEEDGMSGHYLVQLRSTLGIFGRAFTGPIMDVKGDEIDTWLRSKKLSPVTRNNRLTLLRVMFGFAKQRNYLPSNEPTAPDQVSKVKVGATTTEIYQPEEIEKLLNAAPAVVIPYLAIGAFAGLRCAELGRLDWRAVNLERRIIELRADQAKTASRRIVPIPDNLAAWLEPLEREGKVLKIQAVPRMASVLSTRIGLQWPPNVLRHSYISYRVAKIQDANRVALEAGNSPAIIFKHYRELVTEEAAEKWFSIRPPAGWVPPERIGDRSLLTSRKKKK
jgi:integrase